MADAAPVTRDVPTATPTTVTLTPTGCRLAVRNIATFDIDRDGTVRVVSKEPPIGPDGLDAQMFGPVEAIRRYYRGHLVLHASGVVGPSGAVGFMGHGGAGKSTLAAVLRRRGWRVLTDDLLSTAPDGPVPLVLPGPPHLRMWPATAAAVGLDPAALPKVVERLEKRLLPLDMPKEPVPLAALYVIRRHDGPAGIEPLQPHEGFLEVTRNVFNHRLAALDDPVRNFRHCERVAARVPIRRLLVPHGITRVNEAAELVEGDAPALP